MGYATRLDNQLINSSIWTNEITSFDLLTKGLHSFDFNNWSGNSELTIKTGSAIESNDAIYIFDSEESIAGDLSSYAGKVFIRTSSTGLVYDTTMTVLPDWNPIKRGYYDTSNNRILASCNYELGVYSSKRLYLEEYDPDIELENSSGDIYIDAQLVSTNDWLNIKIGAYTYGTGYANGDSINTVYIYRSADNKTYEKLFEASGVDFVADRIFYVNGKILVVYEKHDSGDDSIYYPVISDNLTTFSDPLWGFNNKYSYSEFLYTNGVWLLKLYYAPSGTHLFSYSSDCATWTTYSLSDFYHTVTTFNNLFISYIGISNNRKYIRYSSDGATWANCIINTSTTLTTGGDFEEANGILYYVGDVNLSSTDGMTFNEVTL